MRSGAQSILPFALSVFVLLFATSCGGYSRPIDTVKAPFQVMGGSFVRGTVTYRERISLSPEAQLVVELRDVSLADAAAPLIASQTIENPGQVPISFRVDYDRDSIDSRRTYGISARIIEPPDRLAFINDTAHDVITNGNPRRVDMVLKLAEPPPEMLEDPGADWRTWVETPAEIIGAGFLPNESENYLRIQYYQSTIEGCARPGRENVSVDGNDIIAVVTLMQPPLTPWEIPCDDQVVELDTILPLGVPLASGETYRVIVNDREIKTVPAPPVRAPGPR